MFTRLLFTDSRSSHTQLWIEVHRNKSKFGKFAPRIFILSSTHVVEDVHIFFFLSGIQHFFRLSPDSVVDDVQQDVRRALCDPDPAVMGASLNLLRDIIRYDPESCKDLVIRLVRQGGLVLESGAISGQHLEANHRA